MKSEKWEMNSEKLVSIYHQGISKKPLTKKIDMNRKDLDFWKKNMDFVELIYKLT